MSEYKTLFEKFSHKTVLIVGDVMVDSYVWGRVDRISPEAPVPVVSVDGKEHRLGGAANVALNINSLGATPLLCSIIGNDETGNIFSGLMSSQGLDTRGLVVCPGRKTTSKTRVMSGAQHCLRIDDEVTTPIRNEQELLLVEKIVSLITTTKVDAIIFEDYDKG